MEARVVVHGGLFNGQALTLRPGETKVLGRGAASDLRVSDPSLAPQHAAFTFAPPRSLAVVHLPAEAARTTTLNGRALPPRRPEEVRPGDKLQAGQVSLRVEVQGGALEAPAGPRERAATLKRLQRLTVGEYELERELGAGALGRVFAAVRRRDGLRVAIKALHGAVAEGSPEHARFVREGGVAARIDSPHVVKVHEVVAEKGRAYIVMERVEGPTLRAFLERGPLPVREALRWGEHVALALAAAARAGVVHRDVKPANVFVTGSVAKLGDFGAGKGAGDAPLTATGQGLGSAAYMAPEQVRDAKRAEAPADAYGLGATLYHLLAGRPPFNPRNAMELEALHAAPPRNLRELDPDVPAEVAELVHALLAKEPAARPTAAQAAERLAALRARG